MILGSITVFGFLVDALSRIGIILVILYYITLICFNMIIIIYSSTASVESLIQELPNDMKRFRFLVFLTYIIIAISFNFFYVGSGLMFKREIIFIYLSQIFITCTLILNISITFIYPLSRFYSDYFFTYGSRPLAIWRVLWRVCPILMLVQLKKKEI